MDNRQRPLVVRGACESAAGGGHLDVLQWLRSTGHPWGTDTCYEAARGGHLEVLRWARANGCPWNKDTCHGAAEAGRLEALQWARATAARGACVHARKRPRKATWRCFSGRTPTDVHGMRIRAHMRQGTGDLEVLKWAKTNGCPWGGYTCVCAARNGRLEVLQWARANGCPWDKAMCMREATKGKHADVVAWLRSLD